MLDRRERRRARRRSSASCCTRDSRRFWYSTSASETSRKAWSTVCWYWSPAPPGRAPPPTSTPGADAPRVEDRQRERGADREQALGAGPAPFDADAARPRGAGQEDAREVVGLRHADPRRRRGELRLGLADVRPPLEQVDGNPVGTAASSDLLAERPAARHRLRGAPEQDAITFSVCAICRSDVGHGLRGACATRVSACRTSIIAATPPLSRRWTS